MPFELSVRSRYKDTEIFALDDGARVFGTFVPPEEFVGQDTTDWKRHVVKHTEVGFLDALAAKYYGFGYEGLWWAIALANGIINPVEDMKPGDVLLIPPRARVIEFQSRLGKNAAESV